MDPLVWTILEAIFLEYLLPLLAVYAAVGLAVTLFSRWFNKGAIDESGGTGYPWRYCIRDGVLWLPQLIGFLLFAEGD